MYNYHTKKNIKNSSIHFFEMPRQHGEGKVVSIYIEKTFSITTCSSYLWRKFINGGGWGGVEYRSPL